MFSEDNNKDKSNFGKMYETLSKDKEKWRRIEEIISYLKVQKQPFQEEELKRIFEEIDEDGSNMISPEEIKRFFDLLKSPINDFYIDKIVKEFDSDKDGKITEEEFISRMKLQSNQADNSDLTELLEIFKLFDANHDDKICDQDLQNILKALGENFDTQTCKEMMKYLGDESGQINFSKFFELVKDEGKKESYI